ncbi:MAG: alanine racemase [Rhodospirillaceae bacterium]|nr:alanine racemase [Rhodospirillaceae bacterium]|tara:strand:+ start:912 stop:2045 length:1134 start_codon:yes stop_codon:yes gene_type:complete
MTPLVDNHKISNSFLEINIDSIIHNYQLINRKVGNTECAAVLKADAYGMGASVIAKALDKAGCSTFFVATMDEGIELRSCFSEHKNKIAVLSGLLEGSEDIFYNNKLTPILNDIEQMKKWAFYNRKKKISAPGILHIDTGMNRLGLTIREFHDIIDKPTTLKELHVGGIMSHLACGDQPGDIMNKEQLSLFLNAKKNFPHVKASLANSAGVFLGQSYHLDMVRPGIALYGSGSGSIPLNPLKQVIKLYSRVLQIRTLSRGASVGYGASYKASKTTRVATVGLGYADGYLRSLSNCSWVFFNNVKLPVIGRISMDYITIDITKIASEKIKKGDFIEIIGDKFTLDDLATVANTIPHEILTRLGTRHRRIYHSTDNISK